MSASVATHMAGLPKHDFGPENMPDFSATDFPDHMELDRSTELEDKFNHNKHHHSSPESQRQSSANDAATSEEQKEALGNLLGALMPQQDEQSGNGLDFNVLEHNVPFAHENPTTVEQAPYDDQAPHDPSRLPSLDATAANEIFLQEDFPPFDPNINVPQSPIGQKMQSNSMSHFRQDSFASQASAVGRPTTPQQREFEAFARLQFEDGSYYLNTYSCELGRDVLAYRAALQKEREEKEAELNGHGNSRSSSGRVSQPSGRIRRQIGSQVQGSVVSEQGGFAGIDEAPMRPPKNPEKPTMSSQESESSVVKPAEYLINPRTMPFDYHKSTEMQAKWTAQEENGGEVADDEQPAAVTAAHLPNPHMCPLIPIHGKPKDGQTDAELHKKISRRHVKIKWSFEQDRWEMRVQGRNGAFCDNKFVRGTDTVPLHDGSLIQIAHVVLTFRLPKTQQQQQQETQESPTDVDADDMVLPSVEAHQSESVADDERRESVTDQKAAPKINLRFTQKVEAKPSVLPLGPDGLPIPIPKRRGPGRPPKDGVMSTRERKELDKAMKLALAREANGGKTPPPQMRGKVPKPTPPAAEEPKVEAKPEKRKHTRKRTIDENGDLTVDVNGEDDDAEAGSDEERKTKKVRVQREKSESPEYPPKESLTAEQLARPPENYQNLLYRILSDLYPKALPLKDIYREMKRRYPWYVYEAQTEGWQSSVRHNLNSEYKKLFDKGDKEGKGFAWRAIPNAQLPQTDKKRTTPSQPAKPKPPTQRPQFAQTPGQNIQWQGTGTFPVNEGSQPFINHGPWPQNGTSPNGVPQQSLPPGINTSTQQPSAQNVQSGMPPGQANPILAGPTPGSNAVQPPSATAQPPAPISSSLPSNMPCLLEGIEAIARFEAAMYAQLGISLMPPEKNQFWRDVFMSARKRVLHGSTKSIHPKGDSREEATILSHMSVFVQRFANPNFKGFTQRASQTVTLDGASQAHARTPTQEPEASTTDAAQAPSSNMEAGSADENGQEAVTAEQDPSAVPQTSSVSKDSSGTDTNG